MNQDSMHRLELQISQLLRQGVMLSGVFLLIGWVWMLVTQGDVLMNFQSYTPQSLMESVHWAIVMGNKGLLIAYTGLALLVALPVVRVFLTGFLFIRQKEYVLATMAYSVFFFLVVSVLLGIEHS